MTRLLAFFVVSLLAVSCSYVPKLGNILPDKSKEYKKSESLPDLEVPPDLTAEGGNDSMSIPGEAASLARYQEQRSGAKNNAQQVTTNAPKEREEQWVSVRGNNRNIWPRLRNYVGDKGFSTELNDAELGVLETSWSEPYNDDGFSYRDKFKIFSEPGAEPSVMVLYISNKRQVLAKRQDGTDSWIDKEKSVDAEKEMAGDLNLFFNGSRQASAAIPSGANQSARAGAPKRKAMVESMGDGKDFLAIPEEFTRAWRHTEVALERAGLPIASKDQSRGIYNVIYFGASAEKKEGFLSKLKFWGGENSEEGVPYQITLTGVGDKTELVILNADGEWISDNDALQIMAIIQSHLNR
jgi:outer membrane protein assembly factor BamC